MTVQPIPDGYHTVTPYLVVDGASRFIEFLTKAFQAEEIMRMSGPDGTIRHAEVKVGDSHLMITEACEKMSPTPCMLHLYVEDSDAVYKRAVQAGATSEQEPGDQFYGDRTAAVVDPFGYRWYMATHIEDVSEEELKRRMEAMKANSDS